jgi:hypothetical protein
MTPFDHYRRPHTKYLWVYVAGHPKVKRRKREHYMIPVAMTVGQSFTINVVPIPPNGVEDNPPTYTLDVPGGVTLAPAANGLSCLVTAVAPGVSNISAKGLSLGTPIAGDDTVQVTVSAAQVPATALHVTVTTPV